MGWGLGTVGMGVWGGQGSLWQLTEITGCLASSPAQWDLWSPQHGVIVSMPGEVMGA